MAESNDTIEALVDSMVKERSLREAEISQCYNRLNYLTKQKEKIDHQIRITCKHNWILDMDQELGYMDRRNTKCTKCKTINYTPGY